MKRALSFLLMAVCLHSPSEAFAPPGSPSITHPFSLELASTRYLASFSKRDSIIRKASDETNNESGDGGDAGGVWLPQIRRIMGSIATLGVLETSYLTLNKLQGGDTAFCGVDGGCTDILNGAYSYVPFTEIPLSAMGLLAYLSVLGLSLLPLLSNSPEDDDDTSNRILLTAATTGMGTFSVFLMTLVYGVLQTECPYCEFSAGCSITLAMLAWIGGCLPENSKKGAQTAASAFLTSTVVAVLLFFAGDSSAASTASLANTISGSSSTLLASADKRQQLAPPKITTESSPRAISLAGDLQSLDAKMFGAYWCSHCFDQKESFGKEAFGKIPYIECSKEGFNSQSSLCKSKGLPGYPTWEINGKLYPGEQELEELEEIVSNMKVTN
jgi:uncharacterized membrane protein